MTRSKKHHYVPQSILRKFCVSGNQILYVRNRGPKTRIEPRNISSIFTRRHYNSFREADGRKRDDVEKFFAYELDNYLPEWISVFERASETGRISFSERAPRWRFVQFFFNHVKRSPDFVEPIVEKAQAETFSPNFVHEIRRKFPNVSERELNKFMSPNYQETLLHNSRVQNIGAQSEKILDRLNSMKLHLARPTRSNKQFICGSHPVVRFENYPEQPLGELGVELWTTLTPKLAIGFCSFTDSRELLSIDDSLVRRINQSITKQSSAIAGNCKPLLQSLVNAAW